MYLLGKKKCKGVFLYNRDKKKLWLTELRMVANIFSLNISVREPNIMQHEAITNRSSLLVLMSPVKFILTSKHVMFCCPSLNYPAFGWCHLFTPGRLRSNWEMIAIITSCQLSSTLDTWAERSLSKETRIHVKSERENGSGLPGSVSYL